jgi:hypothetical protein
MTFVWISSTISASGLISVYSPITLNYLSLLSSHRGLNAPEFQPK